MFDLAHLLQQTSRTFALAIPRLPEPTATHVGVGYLLFRIADTLEDATQWNRLERLNALRSFDQLLSTCDAEHAETLRNAWKLSPPVSHSGYMELLDALGFVIETLKQFPQSTREILVFHTRKTTQGMAEFVTLGTENVELRLGSIEQLKLYCYIVAGIVGEMLTDLFVNQSPRLQAAKPELDKYARAFGEGLQLVNILKDASDDARDGRVYLPSNAALTSVFELARQDLRLAEQYVRTLERFGAPAGFVSFCALPVVLAYEALNAIDRSGAGSKINRQKLGELIMELDERIAAGRPVFPTTTHSVTVEP